MNTIALAIIGFTGPWELAIILVIVLIIFGPGKLPSIGKALGDGLKSFKRATNDDEIDVTPTSDQAKELGQVKGEHVDTSAGVESHSKA